METIFEIYNTVALLTNLPNEKLVKGSIGTIVEILDDSTFLVEFSDNNGIAYAFVELKSTQILKLYHELVEEYA